MTQTSILLPQFTGIAKPKKIKQSRAPVRDRPHDGETRGRSRAGARDQKLVVGGLIVRLAVASFEFSYPTTGIENLLLAGVERVALRADVRVN